MLVVTLRRCVCVCVCVKACTWRMACGRFGGSCHYLEALCVVCVKAGTWRMACERFGSSCRYLEALCDVCQGRYMEDGVREVREFLPLP
jgi:hypothetical protein